VVETARHRGLLGRETGRERDGLSGEPLSARARQRTLVRRTRVRDCALVFVHWCLLFVLIPQGLRGGRSGPQRLIRALGEETGNPIMAFHRPSFSPSFERAPHHTTTENPLLGGDPSP